MQRSFFTGLSSFVRVTRIQSIGIAEQLAG
jgi:hypothetical protein